MYLNNVAARSVFLARASSQSLTLNLANSRFLTIPRSVAQTFTLHNVALRALRILRVPNQALSLNAVTQRTAFFYRSLLDLLKLILNLPGETPPPPSLPGAGSGSGGASGGRGSITGKVIAPPSLKGKSFSVDKEEITFLSKVGEYKKEFLLITNTGTEKLDIALSVDILKEYITIPAQKFSLNPGESKEVEIELNAPQEPRVYTSKIIITADGIRKEIPLVLNIKNPESLFDIKLEIPPNYRTSEAGATITVKATLLRLRGGQGAIDVRLTYLLKDLQDQVILRDTEIVGVDTTGSFFKDIHLPPDLKPGSYVVVAEVSYGDSLESATGLIKIVEKKGNILQWIIVFFIFAALTGVISYLVLQKWKHKKKIQSKIKSRRRITK